MDVARSLLLTLLDLVAIQAAGRSPVVVDTPALLAEVATPAVVEACVPLFTELAHGQGNVQDIMPQLDALAPDLAASGAAAKRMAALADHLQTLAALARAEADGALTAATINLASSPLTELVTQWYLDGLPAHCVVCMQGLSSADRLVVPHGDHFLLRRVRIRYKHTVPFPQIETDAPVITVYDATAAPRTTWRQHDVPDYDLQIVSEQGRAMGQIQTRQMLPPAALSARGLNLEFGAAIDAQLLLTTLVDQQGQTLLSVWRWPPLTSL